MNGAIRNQMRKKRNEQLDKLIMKGAAKKCPGSNGGGKMEVASLAFNMPAAKCSQDGAT